jgi:hypothetical protein
MTERASALRAGLALFPRKNPVEIVIKYIDEEVYKTSSFYFITMRRMWFQVRKAEQPNVKPDDATLSCDTRQLPS